MNSIGLESSLLKDPSGWKQSDQILQELKSQDTMLMTLLSFWKRSPFQHTGYSPPELCKFLEINLGWLQFQIQQLLLRTCSALDVSYRHYILLISKASWRGETSLPRVMGLVSEKAEENPRVLVHLLTESLDSAACLGKISWNLSSFPLSLALAWWKLTQEPVHRVEVDSSSRGLCGRACTWWSETRAGGMEII